MLCSPVLTSFAESKLLDFFPASGSTTLCINRTLCVAHYIQYMHITLGACALGTVAKMLVTATAFLAQLTGELSMDEAGDSGFFSTLRVCMFSCHALWYPLTLWLAKLVDPRIVDMQYCSVYFSLTPRFCFKMF